MKLINVRVWSHLCEANADIAAADVATVVRVATVMQPLLCSLSQ